MPLPRRIRGSFHRRHVPFHKCGHQTGTHRLPAGKGYICTLDMASVASDIATQPFCLIGSKRLFHRFPLLLPGVTKPLLST